MKEIHKHAVEVDLNTNLNAHMKPAVNSLCWVSCESKKRYMFELFGHLIISGRCLRYPSWTIQTNPPLDY